MSEALNEALTTVFAIDDKLKPYFDERQQKELQLALVYKHAFNHGTTGHNAYVVMAKLYEVALSAEGRFSTLVDDYRKQTSELLAMVNRVAELEKTLFELAGE